MKPLVAAQRLRTARRLLDRHRRLGAALCAAGAVGAALAVLAPTPPPAQSVLATVADLPAGHVVTAADLRRLALPPAAVPGGAFATAADVVGRSVALPMRTGEVLTDVRLTGPGLIGAVARDGLVGVPVRIADAGAVALLRAGDRVDVLGAAEGQPSAIVVASAVLVVDVPVAGRDTLTAPDGGALVVLATTPGLSRLLAQAAVTTRLSVVVRG